MGRVYLQPGESFISDDNYLYTSDYIERTMRRISQRYGYDELPISAKITIGLDEDGPFYEMVG